MTDPGPWRPMPTPHPHPKRRRVVAGIALALTAVAAVGVTACGSEAKTDAPEPTPDNIVNGQNTQVIRMPDGFRNVAVTCYKGNMVFVTSRGAFQSGNKDFTTLPSTVAVVANSPACPKG